MAGSMQQRLTNTSIRGIDRKYTHRTNFIGNHRFVGAGSDLGVLVGSKMVFIIHDEPRSGLNRIVFMITS